ncbi:MAG: hypothetical protein HZC11_05280 [Nitrospirae bacterium]|nr:hypothetical protein [Nitrospirota bacterium]
MSTATENKRVSNMTVRELKSLIRDTISELVDPDYGMELRPGVAETLRKSMKSKKRTPVEKVASELGLKW